MSLCLDVLLRGTTSFRDAPVALAVQKATRIGRPMIVLFLERLLFEKVGARPFFQAAGGLPLIYNKRIDRIDVRRSDLQRITGLAPLISKEK